MRFFIVLSLAAAVQPLICGAQTAEILYPEAVFPELRPLLERALLHAPSLEMQQQVVEERRGQALSREAAARSRVDAYANLLSGYEMRYNPGEDDNPYVDTYESRVVADVNASVWWRKPIVSWGNNARTVRIAELSVEASELEFAQLTRQHLNDVRENFLRWQEARARLDLAEQNIEAARKLVDSRRRLYQAGETSELSVLELEARLQSSEEVRAYASSEETYRRNLLKLAVGDDAAVEAIDLKTLPAYRLLSAGRIAELRERLLGGTFDSPIVEREELNAASDETYYELVSRQTRPTVDLTAGLRTDRVDSYNIDESSYRLTSYLGLQMQWSIWDGKRNEGERMAALARKRQREARIAITEGRLRADAERAFADLELNVRQAETRQTRVEMLQRRLRLARSDDGSEFVAPFERLELQLDLLGEQTRVLEAKVQYLINMARLAALFYADPVGGL